MKFTKSEKQLVINAIKFFKENNKIVKPHLVAFIDNDVEFIEKFNSKAESFNATAKADGGYLTATFCEQIQWDIEAFREVKEIREMAA